MGDNEPNPTPSASEPEKRNDAPDGAGAAGPADAGEGAPAVEARPAEPAEDPELVAAREAAAAAKRDLEQAQARLRAVSKAYTDLQAENRAFKERMESRAKLDSELQVFDQVRTFFDPVMNLKRSITSPGDDVKTLVEGLRIVHHQFMEALGKLGLEEIPGVGATFDPNQHEALAVTPVDDKSKDGKVLEVLTTGYRVKGRVLQAAQVVIGKYVETSGEA